MLNYEKDDKYRNIKQALMRAIAGVADLDNLTYLQSHPDKAWVSLLTGRGKRGRKIRERYELTLRRIG